MMNDAARNKFFGEVDLAALDIERGREWGTPSYTHFRSYCGLGNAREWSDLLTTHSQDDIDKLKSVYELVFIFILANIFVLSIFINHEGSFQGIGRLRL